MPKLDKEQTLALGAIVVKLQNRLKGRALDQARLCLTDVQFKQFGKFIKDYESGQRQTLMPDLMRAGLIEQLVSDEDMARLK